MTSRATTSDRLKTLSAFAGAVLLAAVVGNLATARSVTAWYPSLAKPWWTPPSWLFGPVWTALYAMMAWAAARVWARRREHEVRRAMALFAAQLGLNALWSILFFGLRSPSAAAVEIVILWMAIAGTLVAFARIDRIAAWLLAPYLAWVSFAAALTFSIAALNPL